MYYNLTKSATLLHNPADKTMRLEMHPIDTEYIQELSLGIYHCWWTISPQGYQPTGCQSFGTDIHGLLDIS
jgi:hypothetical protein